MNTLTLALKSRVLEAREAAAREVSDVNTAFNRGRAQGLCEALTLMGVDTLALFKENK